MRCSVCYHNHAVIQGLCTECAWVVWQHQPANSVFRLNRDPLGAQPLVLSGVSGDGRSY